MIMINNDDIEWYYLIMNNSNILHICGYMQAGKWCHKKMDYVNTVRRKTVDAIVIKVCDKANKITDAIKKLMLP